MISDLPLVRRATSFDGFDCYDRFFRHFISEPDTSLNLQNPSERASANLADFARGNNHDKFKG
ncbi:hypothetical protein [Rhizobium leguminosarum]|uniref:hypothetical protein n=1 Tax=Rhizobium leguminosarum TaxID=384 RepID=UPI00159EDFA9|nr:hypothetical protein [Rhizobium leguminosarum]